MIERERKNLRPKKLRLPHYLITIPAWRTTGALGGFHQAWFVLNCELPYEVLAGTAIVPDLIQELKHAHCFRPRDMLESRKQTRIHTRATLGSGNWAHYNYSQLAYILVLVYRSLHAHQLSWIPPSI